MQGLLLQYIKSNIKITMINNNNFLSTGTNFCNSFERNQIFQNKAGLFVIYRIPIDLCLFVCFTFQSRLFDSYGNVIITGEGLQNGHI